MKSPGSLLFSALLLAAMIACGGDGGGGGNGNNNPPPDDGGGGDGGGRTPVGTPAIVTVTSGATASGVNIRVSTPANSPSPNAEVLGVTNVGEGGSAFNTGAQIRRGTTKRVIIFGAGLNQVDEIDISGPNDITISNIQQLTSGDTPGLSFTAAVSGNAALGGRTVILRTPEDDITTFAGGLEVVQ